jgi:hypothetical protein
MPTLSIPMRSASHPVFLPNLQVFNSDGSEFRASQHTAEENKEDRAVTFAPHGVRARSLEELFPLYLSATVRVNAKLGSEQYQEMNSFTACP